LVGLLGQSNSFCYWLITYGGNAMDTPQPKTHQEIVAQIKELQRNLRQRFDADKLVQLYRLIDKL
jgi:hypothetical protein